MNPKNHLKVLLILLMSFSFKGYSQSFNYVWHQGCNLTGQGLAIDVIAKPDNSLLVLYRADNFDIDPSRYAVFTNGCTVAKYDQQRRLLWNVSLGGDPSHMTEDNVGNIYIYGNTTASFDADPGPGVVTLSTTGQLRGYIIQLDPLGQFVWAYEWNCYTSFLSSIAFDQSNNLYMYGNFQGTLDTDPGAGVNNIVSTGSGSFNDILMMKLSPGKTVLHVMRPTAASSYNALTGELFIENNTIYVCGSVNGTVNFNPLGTASLQNTGASTVRSFVAKYDTSLIFKNLVLWDAPNSPHISSAGLGNVIVSGACNSPFDANPSAATNMTAYGGLYTISLDTAFNYHWNFSLNMASFQSAIYRVVENTTGDVLLLGEFRSTIDLDPSAANFSLTPVSAPTPDVFMGLYSNAGNFKTGIKVSSSAFKNIKNVTIGDGKRVFLPLGYRGTTDLDPGAGVMQYSGSGPGNAPLLIEYSLCTPNRTTISPVICRDATYVFGDSTFNTTGTYKWIYNSPVSCDSIVTLNLTVNQPDTRLLSTRDTLMCYNSAGTSFQWMNCTDNALVPAQTNSYYFPPDNDSYAAIITSSGCTDTTQCVQRLQNSNPGNPALDWGSFWVGNGFFGSDRTMITDQYGNFYVTGRWQNNARLHMDLWNQSNGIINSFLTYGGGGSDDGFIAKYNNDGVLQWAYPFGSNGTGGENDGGTSLAVDKDGNVYATGYYTKVTDFDPEQNSAVIIQPISALTGGSDYTAFILKLNSSGQFVWVKTMGDQYRWIKPLSIALAPDGSIAIGGDMENGANVDFDPGPGTAIITGGGFFAKYDNSGNYLGGLGLPESSISDCTSLTFDSQNNLIIAGTMSANTDFDLSAGSYILTSGSSDMNYFLAKYSPSLGFLWANRNGSHSTYIYPKTSLQTDRNNIIYVMRFSTLMKYNTSGTLIYTYPLSATGYSTTTHAFDIDNAGNVYITELVQGTVTLQPGKTLAAGAGQKLVAKYNRDGTNAWGFLMGYGTAEHPLGIAADDKGNVFVVGTGMPTPFDIDPSAAVYNLNTLGTSFVAKYGNSCSAIDTAATISGDSTVMTAVAPNAYYVWKRCSNGEIVSEGLLPQFSPDSTGSYYCVINMGTCVDSTTCRFMVAPPSVYIASTSLNICPNNPITFTASSISMGSSPNYQWFLDGVALSGETGVNYTSSSLTDGNTVFCAVTDPSPPATTLYTNTLTVNMNSYISSSNYTLCSGQNLTVGSNVYSSTGNYTDSLFSFQGCDSIVHSNITVLPLNTYAQSPVICAGQNILVGTQMYSTSGIYTDTLSSFLSCDSIVTTSLTVRPLIASSQSYVICPGQSILVGTQMHSTSGIYTDTLSSFSSCDSIVTTNLTVLSLNTFTQSPVICEGQNILVGTQTYSTSGTYTDTLSSYLACDSIVTTNLFVNSTDTSVAVTASTLTANASVATYQWLNCTGNTAIAGQTAQSFSPIADGLYAVLVTQNGCSDTSSCYLMIMTGLTENDPAGEITIYPNPFFSAATITFSKPQTNLVIKIKGLLGNEIRSEEFSGKHFVIEKNELSKGIYFVEIGHENKVLLNKKIIIQ
jgi:hypothetical protein